MKNQILISKPVLLITKCDISAGFFFCFLQLGFLIFYIYSEIPIWIYSFLKKLG